MVCAILEEIRNIKINGLEFIKSSNNNNKKPKANS